MTSQPDLTGLLREASRGEKAALDQLLPLVYDELRRLADSYLSRERADHTLQPTALVHEAYVRLVDQRNVDWRNRAQFYGLAARMMRRILVNHAEAHRAAKRGGGARKLSLDESLAFSGQKSEELLALNEALERLCGFDEQKCRVVELKYFCGLTDAETAEAIGKSVATVEREWKFARAWLRHELTASPPPG